MKRPTTTKPTKANKPAKATTERASQTDPAVEAFVRALEHPLKREIELVRAQILAAGASVLEAVKWNAPSFRTRDGDFFATFHLRARDRVQLVFHTGAKTKPTATTGLDVADPSGLLTWLAKDRAMAALGAGRELEAKLPALQDLVRAWVRA